MLLRVVAGGLLIGAAWLACSAPVVRERELLCTPAAYVYCTCADRTEGTKKCLPSGGAFEECNCGTTNNLFPDDGGGSQLLDSGTGTGLVLDERCTGKLAVVASGAESLDLNGAAYIGDNKWQLSSVQGPALRAAPRGALVGDALVAVWRTRYQLIGWTRFIAGQKAIVSTTSLGNASTQQSPTLIGGATTARVYHLADDGTHKSGVYSVDSGWDDAVTVVPSAEGVLDKSAPVAGTSKGNPVLVFSGGDGAVYSQTQTNGTWAGPVPITGATVLDAAPEMVGMEGSRDLLVAYVGKDLRLHSVAHDATSGKWDAPILVDTVAAVDGTITLAAIGGGRAILAWKGPGASLQYSVWNSTSLAWAPVAGIAPAADLVARGSPSISRGLCGGPAVITWVDQAEGGVHLAFYENDDWRGPYNIPGLTKMTFAGSGEVP